jgi:hypothetical protein
MAPQFVPRDRSFYCVLMEDIAEAIDAAPSVDAVVEAMAVMDVLTTRLEEHFDGLVVGDGRGMEIDGRRYVEMLFSVGG